MQSIVHANGMATNFPAYLFPWDMNDMDMSMSHINII